MSGTLIAVVILIALVIVVLALVKKSPEKIDTKQDFPYVKLGPLFK